MAGAALADAVVEINSATLDEVEVGRELGMLVGAVGRLVMNGCIVENPATTTEVDVLISVTVLDCGICEAGGGDGAACEALVAEADVT